MVEQVDYSEISPLLNVDLDRIISNVPFTNVGMVALSRGGTDPARTLYTYPRDPIIEQTNLLNYGPMSAGDAPAPETYVRTYPQTFGDLERTFAPKESTEIYNTELNPYDPSSQFFPYQQDASGIMAVEALRQPSQRQPEGVPIYDLSESRPDLFGVQGTYLVKNPLEGQPNIPVEFDMGLNVDLLMRKKGYIDSTVLHEAKHFFENKYGYNTFDKLTPEQKHKVIYMTQGMFYNQGIDKSRTGKLSNEEAMALMQAQAMGLAYLQNKMFPQTKESTFRQEVERAGETIFEGEGKGHIHTTNINGTHSHGGSTHTHSDGGSTGNVSSGGSTDSGSTGGRGFDSGGGGTVVIGGQPGGRPSRDPVQERQRISDILEVRRRGANIGFKAGGLASINHLTRGL